MKKYKIFNKYEHLTISHGYLTDLVTVKAGIRGTKKLGDKPAVHSLLQDYLLDFGIYIGGATYLRDDKTGNDTDIQVLYSTILADCPSENLGIFKYLYGYTNSIVNIGLDSCDDYVTAIDFYTESGSAILQRWRWGTVDWSLPFKSISDAVEDYRRVYKKVISE